MSISSEIINWYQKNKRDLPWRNTNNPYKIWLSEVILQQTRVEQGFPYYYRFIDQFPTIESLANASEDHVFKLWEGLGYYSRAKNLHLCAKIIVQQWKGKFPILYDELLSLPGIGPYTAAAIASFVANEPKPVLDGNVFRWIARYYGIEAPINIEKNKKIFYEILNDLIPKNRAGLFNQAIMEFGAIQCSPQNPNCSICILQSGCYALKNKAIEQLPVKEKKGVKKNRYLNYFKIEFDDKIMIQQRSGKDIWNRLFELPLIETSHSADKNDLLKYSEINNIIPFEDFEIVQLKDEVKHVLSHQLIYGKIWEVRGKKMKSIDIPNGSKIVDKSELLDYAFPKLILKLMEN